MKNRIRIRGMSGWWFWLKPKLSYGIMVNDGGVPSMIISRNIIYVRSFHWRFYILLLTMCRIRILLERC